MFRWQNGHNHWWLLELTVLSMYCAKYFPIWLSYSSMKHKIFLKNWFDRVFFSLFISYRECRLLVLIQITSSCFDWHSLLLSTFWWVTSQTKFLVISFHLLHLIPSHCLGNLDLNFQFIFMLAFSAVSFGKSWGREQDSPGIFGGNLITLTSAML